MTAGVQDGTQFVARVIVATLGADMRNIYLQLLLQYIDFVIQAQYSRPCWREAIPDFLEYPRTAKSGTTYHHGIHAASPMSVQSA